MSIGSHMEHRLQGLRQTFDFGFHKLTRLPTILSYRWVHCILMMCTHLAEVIPLRGCQVVEAETTAGMHQKLVESLRRYCVWPGISPVSSDVDSRGQGQGAAMTGRLMGWLETDGWPDAGLLWPWKHLKVKPGKKSQKQVTIDNTAGVAALCYSVVRLVSMRVDVTVLH